jgi:hypothetical protein
VAYRGQKETLAEFLPLDSQNWITCANTLQVDWLSICPPTGTGVTRCTGTAVLMVLRCNRLVSRNRPVFGGVAARSLSGYSALEYRPRWPETPQHSNRTTRWSGGPPEAGTERPVDRSAHRFRPSEGLAARGETTIGSTSPGLLCSGGPGLSPLWMRGVV